MFSLKRISKIFLSVLCMLSCVCGFSFVYAKEGDVFTLGPVDGKAIFATQEVGIGKWVMIKNEGRGKTVPIRVEFVQYGNGRIVAREKDGLKRRWWVRLNRYDNTGDLLEINKYGQERVIKCFVGHQISCSEAVLDLTDSLRMAGSIYGYCGVDFDGEYKYDFDGKLLDCPEKVKILMACFLPEGPLSHVSETWKDCGVPV